ncbi:MAG: glycine betaine ABC transporter substrate-binding protein [Hylemonella sp.]|nr:glycine betaine ABC transporter substrate-binding protein [Hylemonella sp.]
MPLLNLVTALLGLALALPAAGETLRVGSKRFTEAYILAEIATQTAQAAGEAEVSHRQGLGNTAILLSALQAGSIDVYPEYTGTIAREILRLDHVPPLPELNARLAPLGLRASVPLGFNNSYALAMREPEAAARGITRLSDLKNHPGLRLGLSQEFIGRADGWPGLQAAYTLPQARPRGLDHGLAYEALAQRQVDAIDVYTTDAKIGPYQLRVLVDDAGYFPRYEAVLLHQADLPARLPRTWAALARLEGRIDEATMRRLNAGAELQGQSFQRVAQSFLAGELAAPAETAGTVAAASERPAAPGWLAKLFGPDLLRLTLEHLALVFLSLGASMLLGIPLGIVAARFPRAKTAILGATGVLQTIPSLALLAILIPLTGSIGLLPAFIALTVYALLPIVRNTHAGLSQVPGGMKQAALALGLRPGATLRLIELPLARSTILAGIKTSAVINVGTATIAAFIGAGGFGERIVTGLALNDNATLLAGAIPVALLALLIEGGFTLAERRVFPESWRKTD